MFRRIYLDNSATTQIDPEVLAAMMPYLTDKFGNASSIHHFGQETRAAVDKARHQVAGLINARPNEIVFTSGGTESNNLAIRGLLQRRTDTLVRSSHIITSAIEHPAVKNVCEDLERNADTPVRMSAKHEVSLAGGARDADKSVRTPQFSVTYLPVYENGIVKVEDVEAALTDDTVLISIMTANNEIGTIQPVAEIGGMVRKLRESGRKIWFHTDAVQAVGKMLVDVEEIGCDLLSLSGHKIHAPKGIGALYVRRGVRLHPQNIGGRQERELRGGTEPVAQIVALGKACEIADRNLESTSNKVKALRDSLETRIGELIPDITYNGNREHRLPNISNISFRGVEGEGLLINLDMQGIAVSTGSACSSGSLEPSPIIRALYCGSPHEIRASDAANDDELARGAIRFSLGRFNTAADIDRVLGVLPTAVANLRRLAPRPPRSTY
ncbi:MAG: cysteine desulfurase family protein [Pyrinomonadaceae bacterium]